MKRVLKILGMVLLGLILLILAGGLYINFSGIPNYEVDAPDLQIAYTPERVAQGERIVTMVCAECHRSESGNVLSGKKLLDIPKSFGTAYSANITNDAEYGIG